MKTFVLTVIYDDDEVLKFNSKNDGFGALELAGIMAWKTNDIYDQLRGSIKPDLVKRELVV